MRRLPQPSLALGEVLLDHPAIVINSAQIYRRLIAPQATRRQPLLRSTVESYFARIVTAAGLQPRGAAHPRLHDLRHTFATAHMAAAYRGGGDPQRTLTLLSTWLGHTSTAHTYWYLSATPELMALSSARLDQPQDRS